MCAGRAHPGSADGAAKHQIKDAYGVSIVAVVPQPLPIEEYNKFMGGVNQISTFNP